MELSALAFFGVLLVIIGLFCWLFYEVAGGKGVIIGLSVAFFFTYFFIYPFFGFIIIGILILLGVAKFG